MLKTLFYDNTFYLGEDCILTVHYEYPPIISIYEIIPCVLDGGFSVSLCKASLLLLSLSIFMPMVKEPNCNRSFFKLFVDNAISLIILLLLLTLIVVSAKECDFLKSILIDCVLGLVGGFAM